VQHTLQMSDS